MKRKQRTKAIWIATIAALAMAAIVIPLLVFAGSEQATFTATLYSNVIRFEADGVASLRVTIYDLSENELWSSGQVMGDFADWDRTNERGERLANGYYIYLAQGWDSSDALALNKTGKIVLLPGDQVQLKAAPVVSSAPESGPWERDEPVYGPQQYEFTGDYTISGKLGVGTNVPMARLSLTDGSVPEAATGIPASRFVNTIASYGDGAAYFLGRDVTSDIEYMMGVSINGGAFVGAMTAHDLWLRTNNQDRLTIKANTGNVGIGTINATDKLTIEGSSGNLIACYPGSSRAVAAFRVVADGNVHALGTVYADAFVPDAGADVAERINVSEWVEAGDVVEIDPDHVGFFRKATGLYSRRVAGIISTSPGVILGNDIDPGTDKWDDNRPLLAIAGRVPVKVSTDNGPIAVGDLLVSSSVPGVAMKGDPAVSIGAVVGKAMEALASGEGAIMAQVTLR